MTHKVLIVGGGAREHAIAAAVARSGGEVYATLKNRNPGILRLAREHKLVGETDADAIANAAKSWGVDVAVLGMDAAIAAGVADELLARGISTASPTKAAGEIEWNKAFMRKLLDGHDVPGRIRYGLFDTLDGVREYVDELGAVAVKPLGLTGGKGVKVTGDHLEDTDDAVQYAREIFEGEGEGAQVLVEEKLEGEEYTLMGFSDGRTFHPMPAIQDHKRAFEGDEGPNTGGMGAYSDANPWLPFMTRDDYEEGVRVSQKLIDALRAVGRPFVGTIYPQFMLTKNGPRFIEVNARFGDPEAMNALEVFDGDYVELLHGMANGQINKSNVRFKPLATVCKYVVPEGYGTKSMADQPVTVDEDAIHNTGTSVYYASVNETPDGLRTTTSRSVGLVAAAPTLEDANAAVDRALEHVKGPHLAHRKDIGTKALIQQRVEHMRALRG